MSHSIESVIDRHSEIVALEQLCEHNSEKRILFVEAITGYGKTALMDKFWAYIGTKNLPRAFVELSPHVIDETHILHKIADAWGIEHFCSFRHIVESEPYYDPVLINKNVLVGWGQSKLGIQVSVNENAWNAYIRRLTEAWLEDARNIPSLDSPYFVLMDDYNSAGMDQGDGNLVSRSVERWYEMIFLPRVVRIPHLRLVVSGRKTPRIGRDIETYALRCQLGPIHSVKDWMQFVRHIRGAELPYEAVRAVCIVHDGHPLLLATALLLLCDSWTD